MTTPIHRLPDGRVPVLLSANARDLVRDDARALLSYAADHPEVAPHRIADMLLRTRMPRRHRALAMVADRAELVSALHAVIDGRDHPRVVRTNTPAATRRLAYVFPGQGGQRPGMGRLFYDSIPAFRAEADRCAEAFAAQSVQSPLDYLLDDRLQVNDCARIVQPALFTQMAALAATWQSFGVAPDLGIGHSQGEIAAAYVCGMMTLADAAVVVTTRAGAVDELARDDYAMAVVAADRDTCEEVLARRSGWAQVSVINSANMVAVSGDRETVRAIVDTFTERGTFARAIRVHYPAHTGLMDALGDELRANLRRRLANSTFLAASRECLGTTLGGPITEDTPVDRYWFWNLRNTVRFDKAIAAASARGVRTFVELSEHPTLQSAIQENLAVTNSSDKEAQEAKEHAAAVVATSQRTASDLAEFTRTLALVAVHDQNYPWDCLRTTAPGPVPLPLPDFPNSPMSEIPLWQPYDSAPAPQAGRTATAPSPLAPARPTPASAPARLLVEEWVRLSHRSLVPPPAIGIIDHTGDCAELATALAAAAQGLGTTVGVLGAESAETREDLDTLVILLPPSPQLDAPAAADEVAGFFGNRAWWPGVHGAVSRCWLVTVGGEAVVADDAPPDPVHAAASAGFRSLGAEHPGAGLHHLDLPGPSLPAESAHTILTALLTEGESELAVRRGGLYAKRIVEAEVPVGESDTAPPGHVLVIGGTGKLGLEFCGHFARRGARRITLVSRSGETPAVADRLQPIRSATPTQIRVVRCDVGDQAAVSLLAAEHADAPADLIIHAAVDYSDCELAQVTTEAVDCALRAKVVGLGRVLGAFPRADDCRVLLCSSIAATIGGRGQIVYAAANRMLDAMAHRLRAEGLDCVSVQWGLWTAHLDLGAAGMTKLDGTGVLPMSPVDALKLGLSRLDRNALVVAFDSVRARPLLDMFGYGPLLSRLAAPAAPIPAPVGGPDRSRRVMQLLAEALGLEGSVGLDGPDAIDTTVPLVAMGLDSLQAMEFHRRVKSELNCDLAVPDLLRGASVADVLTRLGTN